MINTILDASQYGKYFEMQKRCCVMQISYTGDYSVFSLSTATMCSHKETAFYFYIFLLLPCIFTINGQAGSLKLPTHT